MKNLIGIGDNVKVVLSGEGKENVIGNGEIVRVTNVDEFPDGSIRYIGAFKYKCPQTGEEYDSSIQFGDNEWGFDIPEVEE